MQNKNKLLKQSSALVFMALMASSADLAGTDAVAQLNSENYIVHQLEQETSLLGMQHRLMGCSAEACRIYDLAIAREPAITKDMIAIRDTLDIDFYGLGNTLKTAESVLDKIHRLAEKDLAQNIVKQDYEYVAILGDLVRYTFMCEHVNLTRQTLAILQELRERGYSIDEIDNKYLRRDIYYKAIHINATAPNAQKFEIQIHSPESMQLNVFTHKMYEKSRDVKTPALEKQMLREKIKLAYASLPLPEGIETIQNTQG